MSDSALQLYPVPDVARLCAVRPATVRAWIARGELIAVRLGRHYRVSAEALRRMHTRCAVRVAPALRAGVREDAPPNGLAGGETQHIRTGRRGMDAGSAGRPSLAGSAPATDRPAGPSIDDLSSVRASQVLAAQRSGAGFTESLHGAVRRGRPGGPARAGLREGGEGVGDSVGPAEGAMG
jgi:excisionase family DNA binding protein